MKNDPIVDAVRKTREQLARTHDYNVQAIFASLRRGEAELGDRLVSQSPQPERLINPDNLEISTSGGN